MKIWVATYESGSGYGKQKAFKSLKAAKEWLFQTWSKDNPWPKEDLKEGFRWQMYLANFKHRCKYGAWTGKVKMHTL